jgi:nitrogenase molybdenum-iron protein alpha chain
MVECQAGNVRGAVLIQHAPIGCATSQSVFNSIYRNGLAIRGLPVENVNIVCTNMDEGDVVFGGSAKLRGTVEDVWDHYHPKAIFIGTSCASGIIGDDVDSVASEYTKSLGIPVMPLYCEGFRSKHWSTGFDATQHGILRQIVTRDPKRKQEDLVNVINLWGSDVFSPMLKNLNLRVNYVVDMATVEELAQMSEAAATVGFCNTLGTYLGEGLEQSFGIPYLKSPQPYGIAGTDAWIRGLAELTHREKLAEEYIAREHERVKPKIAELKKKLVDVKGLVATGSAYSHGLISVLKELDIQVDGSLVFHHDPIYDSGDPQQDSLAQLVKNYGDVPNFLVSLRQPYQFYTLLKKVNPDFILIRHNGLAPTASRLGIPAAPLGDEHVAVGYEGILNLGNIVLEILKRKTFHKDVAKHTISPYSKWWLEQTDPNIMAKHPEIIWEGSQ